MQPTGFLFDVDGVLTKPLTETLRVSTPDPKVFALIRQLHGMGHAMSFVTGRAWPWFSNHIWPEVRQFTNPPPVFMEYGLVYFWRGELSLSSQGTVFRNETYPLLTQAFAHEAEERGIFFEPETPYANYPAHKSLWVEDKHAILSVAENTAVSKEQAHSLADRLPPELLQQVRVVKHHLGVDFLPQGWSKEQGARQALELLDPQRLVERWVVFGDNPSDREMCLAFEEATFVDTKAHASEDTIAWLEKYIGNLNLSC